MSAIKNISLYIPHVFPNFDKEYIARAFKDIGDVSRIDLVSKQGRDGKPFNAVYVHFNAWYANKKARTFYDSVVDENKEARLVHDAPWYWIVLPNNAKKFVSGDRKPRIDLGESKSISVADANKDEGDEKRRAYLNAVICRPKANTDKLTEKYEAEALKAEEEAKKWAAKTAKREAAKQSVPENINLDFEIDQIEAEMDEIEQFLEEEDENLIRIDGRYVQALEQENWFLRTEIDQLRAALINLDQMYQAEAAKVRAFSSVDL